MQLQNFSKNFLGPKIRYLDRYKYPKKYFFEFFSSIFWGLCTGTKCEKVVLFGISTGTKSEKLNFYSLNILNSLLVLVLNPKSTTFSPLQRPDTKTPRNRRKKFKKRFFWVYLLVQLPYFWNFEKFWSCIWYLVLLSKNFIFKLW
jgi:hypothetical protein